MRKILYRELKKRLSRLLLADSGNIVFVSEERIKQMIEAGETPDYAIRHIGLWNRQVEFIEQEEHFSMPAVFVEFGKMSWRHQQGGLQDTDFTVGLHVLTAALPEGYDGEEFHLDLLDKINRCLHGLPVTIGERSEGRPPFLVTTMKRYWTIRKFTKRCCMMIRQ